MAEKVNPNNLITDMVTFSFTKVFKPAPTLSGEYKYSSAILLPKTNSKEKARWDAAIQQAIADGITKGKFTKQQTAILSLPIVDGDEYLKRVPSAGPAYVGHYCINAKKKTEIGEGLRGDAWEEEWKAASDAAKEADQVSVNKAVNGKAVRITNENEFYSGCKGRAIVSFYAMNVKGNPGIFVALNGCYRAPGDHERLDGRIDATSAFSDMAAEDGNTDAVSDDELAIFFDDSLPDTDNNSDPLDFE